MLLFVLQVKPRHHFYILATALFVTYNPNVWNLRLHKTRKEIKPEVFATSRIPSQPNIYSRFSNKKRRLPAVSLFPENRGKNVKC